MLRCSLMQIYVTSLPLHVFYETMHDPGVAKTGKIAQLRNKTN